MFIPKGRAIHENLATSYVVVDALVADLCEGGFTGVVEVVLRDTDSHVIISRGSVTATVETRLSDESDHGGARLLHRPTVAELAARARLERGRVSVYAYSLATSNAIAGRINSQPLYTRLSSEFADLEKMLSKLGREPDRQWFVEISSGSGLAALIHLNGERCTVITSDDGRPEAAANSVELMQNTDLRSLVDEFNREGGTFDVFFKSVGDSAHNTETSPGERRWIEPPGLLRESLNAGAPAILKQETASTESKDEVTQSVMAAKAAFQSLSIEESPLNLYEEPEPAVESPPDPVPPSSAELEEARLAVLGLAREPEQEAETERGEPSKEGASGEIVDGLFGDYEHQQDDSNLLIVGDDFKVSADLQRASEAEVMAEVKRLMAEITRTIEEAIESVEHRSTFPIHLRAGQLKVADRYPFLDPFGPEFEYLAGEIAFVGHVSPAEFVEALTEALKLAVAGVTQGSAQPSRVRGRVSDALRWLLSRQQIEFEAYGLDESIHEILNG
ncbi:MAG TPA: hypothetical protein VNS63_03290 [Blastocatellia bacterium]|nr:hypothetical protein [Blastocatellia bacterium]